MAVQSKYRHVDFPWDMHSVDLDFDSDMSVFHAMLRLCVVVSTSLAAKDQSNKI